MNECTHTVQSDSHSLCWVHTVFRWTLSLPYQCIDTGIVSWVNGPQGAAVNMKKTPRTSGTLVMSTFYPMVYGQNKKQLDKILFSQFMSKAWKTPQRVPKIDRNHLGYSDGHGFQMSRLLRRRKKKKIKANEDRHNFSLNFETLRNILRLQLLFPQLLVKREPWHVASSHVFKHKLDPALKA